MKVCDLIIVAKYNSKSEVRYDISDADDLSGFNLDGKIRSIHVCYTVFPFVTE